jgi:hypothetical protein
MPETKPSLKKIHKWLSDLESHAIYEAHELAKDFKKKTGLEPCWPVHTVQATAKAITRRGLGGTLNLDATGNSAWGWEIATALADKYGHNSEHGQFMGRGRIFFAALDSLKEK